MREAAQLVKSRGVARGGPRKDLAGCELSVNRKLQVMEYYLAKAPNILASGRCCKFPPQFDQSRVLRGMAALSVGRRC